MAYFFIVRMARGSVILALSLVAISCSSLVKVRDTSIPELLAPVASSDVAGLLNRVEPFTSIQALRASRVLIQFIDVESKDKYRTADAILAVQRPDKIRLVVQIPVTGTRIAEMVSEANRFRVAIYLDSYKRFLTGTNNADYSHWKSQLGEKQRSAIINARPFHFTEALMMVPLRLKDPDYAYSLEEALVEETDMRASAKKNARVLRSFYVVSEVALNRQGAGGGARTLRRFWFDRTNGLLFTRQQLFDEKGSMSTEIHYSGYQKLSDENAHVWPTVVLVSRPYDNYAARLTFASGRFEVNPDDLSPNAFVLENTENLPVTDLDGPVTR